MATSTVRAAMPTLRLGNWSWRCHPRSLVLGSVLLAAAVLLAVVTIGIGDYTLSPVQVTRSLLGIGDPVEAFVVRSVRAPRAVAGLLVGFALGVAGAITQIVTRNPLATPDILGISAGAGAAAVAVIVLGGQAGLLAAVGIPTAALLGGAATAVAIYLLAARRGVDGFRLILVGIGMGAVMTAVTTYLLARADITQASRAVVWLTGSIEGRSWTSLVPLIGAVLLTVPLLPLLGFTVGALRMDPDTARALGARVGRSQPAALLVAVVLTSLATAAAGPITFIAFVAPQLAMRLGRTTGQPLTTAGLTGAVLVLGSDVVGRLALPVELPVGIVTAMFGAPFFVALLVRRRRTAAH